MKTSNSIENISKALVATQKEIKDVAKTEKGFGYKYAPLDQVLKMARPILTKHGLSVIQSQTIKEGEVEVVTRIIHQSGEWIEVTASAPFEKLKGMNAYQSAGSAITYLRRYSLSAALGISSDEDTDAAGEAETIGEEQVLELEELITKTRSDKEKLLQFFKVKRLEELNEEQYKKAKLILERRLGGN